jgi:hypothetical protein
MQRDCLLRSLPTTPSYSVERKTPMAARQVALPRRAIPVAICALRHLCLEIVSGRPGHLDTWALETLPWKPRHNSRGFLLPYQDNNQEPTRSSAPLFANKLLSRTAEIAGTSTGCRRGICCRRRGGRNARILAEHRPERKARFRTPSNRVTRGSLAQRDSSDFPPGDRPNGRLVDTAANSECHPSMSRSCCMEPPGGYGNR